MIHFLTRMASIALAFGFFIGCSSSNPARSDAPLPDERSEAQIHQQLKKVDKQLSENPNNTQLLYQKGSLLVELAEKKDNPSARSPIYERAQNTLAQSSVAGTNAGQNTDIEKTNELLKITWSNEHNRGVKILQSDSASDVPDYKRAAAHFNNATIIIPDSSISYKMQARAFYKDQQPQKSIETLERARSNVTDLPAQLLEQLAFLYLDNDEPNKAAAIFEQAESISGQNLNLIHGLSNSYIKVGNHTEAIRLLKVLTENEPDNIIYHERLATELYHKASGLLDQTISRVSQGRQLETTSFMEADSLIKEAEQTFAFILQENAEDLQIKQQLAYLYQNGASKYQQLLLHVNAEEKPLISENIKQFLTSSIPLLKELSNEQPNKRIWKNLYQAYSYLGMKEEASNAKSNL